MLNFPFVQEHLAIFIKEKENLQEALHAKLVFSFSFFIFHFSFFIFHFSFYLFIYLLFIYLVDSAV